MIATTGLRTSLQEIANAAGILTGSLYHHFASKEDLLIELVRRYHADIAQVGTAALRRLDAADSASVEDRVIELASEIARCAVRNRAALQMSFFEAPTESPELMALLRQRPVAIQDAMVQTLRAGRWSGYLRSDVDLVPLADRICQSLLHVGLDVIRRDASTEDVATVLCQLLLHGVAAQLLTMTDWIGPLPVLRQISSSANGNPPTAPVESSSTFSVRHARCSAAKALNSPPSETLPPRPDSTPLPSIG